VLLALICCHAASAVTDNTSNSIDAIVRWDAATNRPWITLGTRDSEKGVVATARFVPGMNSTGWDRIFVTASAAASPSVGAHSVGYAEGYLTHTRIRQFFQNVYADWFGNATRHTSGKAARIYHWLEENMAWVTKQVAANQGDAYWEKIGLVVAQLDGLVAGYNDAAPHNEQLTRGDFLLLNADGDIEAVINVLGLAGDEEMVGWRRKINLRCSALFKLTDDNQDLLFGHSTWDTFALLGPRMLKSYSLGGVTVTMSSSPGFLMSMDDFYLTSNNLVVIETTNGNFNSTLWRHVTPQSVLFWMRVNAANMLARTTSEWGALFSRHNSGTYNNQWMIFDLDKFRPGRPLQRESFLVLEQIPGKIHSEDMSAALQQRRYWGSYNVPYFPDIWSLSGFGEQTPKSAYSHQDCPRAKMFAERQMGVKGFADFQRLMRYNDYQHDPLSLGDSCNAISARCDLNPSHSSSFGLGGGTTLTLTPNVIPDPNPYPNLHMEA